MRKIILMSNVILTLLFLSLSIILITISVVLINGGDVLNLSQANGSHMKIGLEVTGSWQSIAEQLKASNFNPLLWLALPQMVPYILINATLIRLFMLYRQGLFFTFSNIQCFKWLGGVLLLRFLFIVLYPSLLVTGLNMFTSNEVAGRSISIQDTDIMLLIVGLIIYVIAWVMKQAQLLQQEQELVI